MRGRVVIAPGGEHWRVGRRWLYRSPPKPWTRWRRSRKRRDDGEIAGGWLSDAAPIETTGPPAALPEAEPIALSPAESST